VLIQTHLPNDPAIRAATQHDFETFSLNELQERRAYNYPPYMKLARILIRGKDQAATRAAALGAAEALRAGVLLITKTHEDTKKDGILILGPAEPPINKLEGYFRQHILIKAATSEVLSELLSGPRLEALGKLKGADAVIDVDAVSML
jgi:primosomal protein N' (replication factor Y)